MSDHPMMTCGHAANAVCNASGGIKYDPPIPSCAICSCHEIDTNQPDLTGRKARCCTEKSIKDSGFGLAFFEFRGEGSKSALTSCKHCSYAEIAHTRDYSKISGNKPRQVCDNFEPKGPWQYDLYYCGHSGWD